MLLKHRVLLNRRLQRIQHHLLLLLKSVDPIVSLLQLLRVVLRLLLFVFFVDNLLQVSVHLSGLDR